jgi:adenylylsulfate kinase
MTTPGFTFWLTGLSGAGKSSLADAFAQRLASAAKLAIVLDGDEVRRGLCSDLGFSSTDRTENVRRVAEVAGMLNRNGIVVIVALISPLVSDRALARRIVGAEHFAEVFVDAPVDVCERRDVKGLYRKARSGGIAQFSGLSAPYEPPPSPDVHIS